MSGRARVSDETIVNAIREYVESHGYGPAHIDLQNATGISAGASTTYRLRQLRDRGLVTWTPGHARSLRVCE